MAGLILICQRCSAQTDAEDVAEGVCIACRVETATFEARRELIRLRHKRERYDGKGIPLQSLDEQLQRALVRTRAVIEGLTGNAAKTKRHMDALLESVEAEGKPVGLADLLIH